MMNENKLRVLLTTNIPAPYMVDYLSELGKKCELTVLFEIERAKDRVASWYGNNNSSFKSIFLHGIPCGNEAGFSLRVIKYLSVKKYDRIIIANPTTPTGIVALLYCRWFHVPFIIQSEGGFQGSGKGFKEKFKKYIMEKAEFYLTGMGGDNDYFLKYGATFDRLRKYPFTSLKKQNIDTHLVSNSEKNILRKKLGIKYKKVVLSVGQFIYRKGYDILLESITKLDDSIGFYIIGGKPAIEYTNYVKKNNLKNVFFVDFMPQSALKEYYQCADLFVLPTREDTWGLVINEAMANGLPVITTDKCIAGLQLIENKINGFIVKSNDVKAMANRISLLLQDDEKRAFMAKQNIEKIKPYNIENMTDIIFQNISNE